MIVERFVSAFKAGGIAGVLSAIVRRIRTPHARSFPLCRGMVRGATGMEIGGPSSIFARGGLIPVYPVAGRVDNCNFARSTIWEGAIQEGHSFKWGRTPGRQFIAEAADLHMVPSGEYDFVLSSHTLEHTADPLRALGEWGRVLKVGGGLILVLPHRDGTFDHRRPVTTMEHLVEDFDARRGEDDLTHVAEILRLHDRSRDPGIEDEAALRERAERNAEVRSFHHHVFDSRLAMAAVTRAGFEVHMVEALLPYHIVVVARKPSEPPTGQGLSPGPVQEILRQSPFPTDRAC